MKVPSIWVTLGKRGFSSDNFGRLLDSHITGIRLNTGRSSYEWIADTIRSLVAIGFPVKNIYVDIGNNKPRLSIKNEQGFQMKHLSGPPRPSSGSGSPPPRCAGCWSCRLQGLCVAL